MLGIALVHAVLMTIFVFDLVERQRTFLHKQSVSTTMSLSQSLASSSVSWVLANDVIGLEEVIDSQSQFPDLLYAMIVAPDGKVLGHSDRSMVGLYIDDSISRSLLGAEPVSQTMVSDRGMIDIGSPIFANDRLIGWARVGISMEKINAGLKDIFFNGAWYTVFALVVGSIFAWMMARGITSGLHQVVRVADRIRNGEAGARIRLVRDDELGQLGTTLNNLFDTLNRQKNLTQKAQQEQQQTLLEYENTVAQLEEISHRLELAIDGARLGTWDWSIDTGEVVFNERWAQMIGYDLSEIEPHVSTWERFIHPDDHDEIMAVLAEHLAGRTPVYQVEHRLGHKSGTWVWVLSVGRVFNRDEKGVPLRAVGIHLDITEKKEAEGALVVAKERAEAANRAKSVFLANMSHELRTPLNAILGYTQLFSVDPSLNEKQQSGIRTIHRSGEHLLVLINDILDLSKVESGKMKLIMSDFRLPEFLQEIVNIIKVRASMKGLDFYYEPGEGLPFAIRADEVRLRQILLNLLSNAVKFTDNGYCCLSVEVHDVDQGMVRLAFEVRDSGPGIYTEMLEKVFEPFQQAGDRLRYADGSGLGLAISRKLVLLMGGNLCVESPLNIEHDPAKGPGSRFYFSVEVPVLPDPGNAPVETRIVTGYSRLSGGEEIPAKRILIVDDSASNRSVLRDTLEPLGFVVGEAVDGIEVTRACQNFKPDVILMDLRMPKVDGYEATMQLKADPDFADIPVFVVTASAVSDDRVHQRCLEFGFCGYINKPFSTTMLLESLASQLGIKLQYVIDDSKKYDESEQITAPSQNFLQGLLQLVKIGDIDKVLEHIVTIGKIKNGKYAAWARMAEDLAEDMQLIELEDYILKYLTS